ncbi:MAG: hypothetical protein GWN71_08655, partial [Gammaproteobacteria bacterium]|nr:hypothetical protein [Gemmatimonadota bacterium]NIR35211.1 hypothetical protein [Actinomycetota bacterium]NIU73634.1 hypothetical protein [Gammaproteobacteria bacterium]
MLGGRTNRRPLRAALMMAALVVALVGSAGPASGAFLPSPHPDRLAFEVQPGFGDLDTAGMGGEFVMVFPQDVSVTWFSDTFGMRKPSGRRHLGEDL